MRELYCIIGPTVAGKTYISNQISECFPVEIISCDSRQIYKYMNIGTAKHDEYKLKIIKHHFIDIINPDEYYNAKMYSEAAENIINTIGIKDNLPLVVGGTGMYLNALIYGIFDIDIPDILREKLKEMKTIELYRELCNIDKITSLNIKSSDRYRIIRALEVKKHSGKSITEIRRESIPKYKVIYFYIIKNRKELYNDIDNRVDEMIKSGLIEEIKGLLKMGYNFNTPGMKTIGYKEFEDYFSGEKDITEVSEMIKKNTRHYAKRQFTWFNKQIKNGEHYIYNVSNVGYKTVVNEIIERIRKGK
jgi:tRNA dimethylallyltransferase